MLEKTHSGFSLTLARKFWIQVSSTPCLRDLSCKHKKLHPFLLRRWISSGSWAEEVSTLDLSFTLSFGTLVQSKPGVLLLPENAVPGSSVNRIGCVCV